MLKRIDGDQDRRNIGIGVLKKETKGNVVETEKEKEGKGAK